MRNHVQVVRQKMDLQHFILHDKETTINMIQTRPKNGRQQTTKTSAEVDATKRKEWKTDKGMFRLVRSKPHLKFCSFAEPI
jgi:hypothetical protein